MTWRNGNPPDTRWHEGGLHPSGPGRDWWPKERQERPMDEPREIIGINPDGGYVVYGGHPQPDEDLRAQLAAATERAERYAGHIRRAAEEADHQAEYTDDELLANVFESFAFRLRAALADLSQ